jgi:hypothetical protein
MDIRSKIIAGLVAILAASLLVLGSAKADDQETAARNHGYDSAALEVTCGDGLIVTNANLRARLDRMYRENPRWREHFLFGYAAAGGANRRENIVSLYTTCTLAGSAKWLTLDPAARDILTIRMREAEQRLRK